jgi:peptide/nickel transport system ATP-binding protein
MYPGELVEIGATDRVFGDPHHPYTRGLIASVPVVSEAEERMKAPFARITGEIPSAARVPSGCRFHTRCPAVAHRCRDLAPAATGDAATHAVRCHEFPL